MKVMRQIESIQLKLLPPGEHFRYVQVHFLIWRRTKQGTKCLGETLEKTNTHTQVLFLISIFALRFVVLHGKMPLE